MTRTTVKRRVKLTHALVRIASGRRSVLPLGPHGRGSASRHACVALVKSNFGSRLSGAALAALGPAHGTCGVVGCPRGAVPCGAVPWVRRGSAARRRPPGGCGAASRCGCALCLSVVGELSERSELLARAAPPRARLACGRRAPRTGARAARSRGRLLT